MTRVFDASAIVALIRSEPGHERVAELIADSGCIMSAVNFLETERRLVVLGYDPALVADALEELPIHAAPFTREMARRAAAIDGDHLTRPLSLADRACIGAALELDATLVTGDRAWSTLDLSVEVIQIR